MIKNGIFKNFSLYTAALLALTLYFGLADNALAQASSLGDVFCNAYNSTQPFGRVFQWIAYLAGIFCAMQGIYHFKGHTDSPQNFPLHRAVMLWFGASALLALPNVVGAVIQSLYVGGAAGGVMTCTPGSTASGAGAGLDVMMSNFVGNIKTPLIVLVSMIAIVTGIFMVVQGLMKASKYGFDPRSNSIHSILTHVGFGCLLITIGDNLTTMIATVFGSSTIAGSSAISWTFLSALAGGASTQFQTAVTSALTFFQLIGMIAFVRGWLIMKKVVEGGGGNVTLAQGITHILGGVIAINIYAFLKLMDTTFGTGLF